MSEQPGRYQRTFGGLTGAMIVTVLVVLAFVAFRGLFRDNTGQAPQPVDWQESVTLAEQAGLRIVHPTSLPEGWVATSAVLNAGDDPRWQLGVLTKSGAFVGLRQEDASVEELARTYVDEDAVPGEETEAASPVTSTWGTWSDSGGDLGFSTELGDDAVLVYGSASQAELEAFLALLTVSS